MKISNSLFGEKIIEIFLIDFSKGINENENENILMKWFENFILLFKEMPNLEKKKDLLNRVGLHS